MADETTPKKKKGKLLIILLVLVLFLGGGGAAAWFFFLADKFSGDQEGGATTQKVEKAPAPKGSGISMPLPVFTVNLSDPLGKRFIKLALSVELANPAVAAELQQQEPRIRDTIILLLTSKTYADLATMESKLTLKNEIGERLNQILGGPKISQVFITDIVIQ